MLICSVWADTCFFSDIQHSKVTRTDVFGHHEWLGSNSSANENMIGHSRRGESSLSDCYTARSQAADSPDGLGKI